MGRSRFSVWPIPIQTRPATIMVMSATTLDAVKTPWTRAADLTLRQLTAVRRPGIRSGTPADTFSSLKMKSEQAGFVLRKLDFANLRRRYSLIFFLPQPSKKTYNMGGFFFYSSRTVHRVFFSDNNGQFFNCTESMTLIDVCNLRSSP